LRKINKGGKQMAEELENKKQEECMQEETNPEVANLKAELDEKEDRLKRLMAEFDNYKKRSAKERETLYQSLTGDILTAMLPVVDNLEKAVEAQTEDAGYKQGVEMVLKQFKDVLQANGLEEIEAVGKPFDPELHEAVASVVDATLGEKEVKEQYRKGYKIGNKVVRHSMVIVAN